KDRSNAARCRCADRRRKHRSGNWRRALPGWLRKYRMRSPSGCRLHRKDKPGMPECSRGLRTLPAEQARERMPAFRTNSGLIGLRTAHRFVGLNHWRQGFALDQLADFGAVQDLALQQRFSDSDHRFRALLDNLARAAVAIFHQLAHLFIDSNGSRFAVVAMLRDFAAQEDLLFLLAEAHGAKLAHAPLANHLAGHLRGALDIVTGAGSDVVHEYLFRDAAGHQNS